MERFEIKKIEKFNNYFSALIKDNNENINFWIDCSLIDGYGNHNNFVDNDLYIDWEFNQYIFHLENENDIKAKKYQENADNIDCLQDFIDENNEKLVNILK